MRKIEVTRESYSFCTVNGICRDNGFVERLIGEVPPKGETRSYYIITAGDVAELEFDELCEMPHCDLAALLNLDDRHWNRSTKVQLIVHPPDEPKEETVEVNEPDWLSEPDGVGVWWMWDQKSPPVMCSVYDRFDDGDGFMCRTFNGVSQFTADLSGSHLFCRLEYVDLQQWYFNRESETQPPPMPKVGWFEHKGERYTVCDTEDDDMDDEPYVVTPAIVTAEKGLSRWQSQESLSKEGIQVHWYGDDA